MNDLVSVGKNISAALSLPSEREMRTFGIDTVKFLIQGRIELRQLRAGTVANFSNTMEIEA